MSKLFLIQDSISPSVSFFFMGMMVGGGEVTLISAADFCRLISNSGFEDRVCILCRYFPSEFKNKADFFRTRGCQFVYFMDDDLMDRKSIAELPDPYRTRVRKEAFRQRKAIEKFCTDFLVSTPYLAEKYKEWNPRVIDPRPPRFSMVQPPPVWVCYHGTASHQAEFDWLLPLLKEVEAQLEAVRVEVFGDHSLYKRFRELPRVNVLHPMTWPNYLDYTAGVRREIGLAPLLPSFFNAARGHVKFFDFARMGAVGIYSDVPPYRDFVRDGIDGLLLPNDPIVWVKTILELAVDPVRRKRMAAAARERALELAY